MGDFNSDMLDPNNSDTRFVNGLINELSLKLVDTGASHHTDNKKTWIDSIFVDDCDNIISSDCFLPNFSNHYHIISATIDIFFHDPPEVTVKYKAINSIVQRDLNSHLRTLDWTAFSSPNNFDIELGLTNNIRSSIDMLAPEKSIRPGKVKYPWLISDLRLLKSKRDSTSRRYQRTGSRELLNEFLILANIFEEQSEMARSAYMHNRICGALDANKNFWKEMRDLGLIPKANDALHGFSPEVINVHFSNISISANEDPSISRDIIDSTSLDGFSFKEVSNNDVILAVSHFKSQAKGEDGIPQSIIAKALPTIAPYLTKLFNASLSQGIFPEDWKKSRITALKKVAIPSSPSDFRPIALLCFLSKVLEKLAHDQIANFLTRFKILDMYQTSFR